GMIFTLVSSRKKPSDAHYPASRFYWREAVLPTVVNSKQEGVTRRCAADFRADSAIRISQLEQSSGVILGAQIDRNAHGSRVRDIFVPVDVMIGSGAGAMDSASETGERVAIGDLFHCFKKWGSLQDAMQ